MVVAVAVVSVIAGSTASPDRTIATGSNPTAAPASTTSIPLRPTALSPSTTVPAPTRASPPATSPPPSQTGPGGTGAGTVNPAGAVLPNPARTPGATNPDVTQADIRSTICTAGWTSTIRPDSSYTTALKEQQLASGYTYNGDMNTSDYEEDHLIALELGGAPASTLNLWPEPYNASGGARMKDQLENKLNELVCDGALSLATAQHAIATNWYVAYQTYIGAPTSPAPATTPAQTSAPPTATAPPPGSALTCSASMSNPSPADNSDDDVIVHTGVAGASVTATAHYKSTNTTHTGAAGSNGVATIVFDIGGATAGYQVTVDVTVSAGASTETCSTAFTPQ